MVYIYNPELFDLKVSEANTKTEFVFEDIYCRESSKKAKENDEAGFKRIPLVTAKLSNECQLDEFDKLPAYVSSFKKTNKNGKINISARITECSEDRSDVGFIAAVPIRGYIFGFGFDEGIEPLKAVLKYVDKFEFNGEKYTQIMYIVGRASKNLSNLLGNVSFDSRVISKNNVVDTYVTDVVFQNEEIHQETRLTTTEEGEEAVQKAKEAGKDFTSLANGVVEQFAKEFTPRNNNSNRAPRNDSKPKYNNGGFKGELVIPEYQGRDRDRNSRNKKKRRK